MNLDHFQHCFSPSSFALPEDSLRWEWGYGPLVAWLASRGKPSIAVDWACELEKSSAELMKALRAGSPDCRISVFAERLASSFDGNIPRQPQDRLVFAADPEAAASQYSPKSVDFIRFPAGVDTKSLLEAWRSRLSESVIVITGDTDYRDRELTAFDCDGVSVLVKNTDILAPLLDAFRSPTTRSAVLTSYRRLGSNLDFTPPSGEQEAALLLSSGLFDPAFYLSRNLDVVAAGVDALEHYISQGGREGRAPHPLFDSAGYIARYGDLLGSESPLTHYLRKGSQLGLCPNRWFDPVWYRHSYPEIGSMEPLSHYLAEGAEQGLQPSPFFDTRLYLVQNRSLVFSSEDPLTHFMKTAPAQARPPVKLQRPRTTALVQIDSVEDWTLAVEHLDMFGPADVIVTIPPKAHDLERAIHSDYPEASIHTAGTPIEGFLDLLPRLLERADAVCRLHIKPDSDRVGIHVNGISLLSQPQPVAELLHSFATDETVALAGCKGFHLSASLSDPSLFENLREGLAITNPGQRPPGDWGYFSGGTFWFKPEHFTSWATSELKNFFEGLRAANVDSDAVFEQMIGASIAVSNRRVALVDTQATAPHPVVEFSFSAGGRQFRPIELFLAERRPAFEALSPSLKEPRKRKWSAPSTPPAPGVNFIGPVEVVNGLGVSARGYVDALTQSNLQINVVPWRKGFEHVHHIPAIFPTADDQPITIVHLNLDMIHDARHHEKLPLSKIASDQHYRIVVPYWELSSIKPEWSSALQYFDEVWVASVFMKRAIEAVSPVPVRVLRPAIRKPLPTKMPRSYFGLAEEKFVFFYNSDASSVVRRKNPECLVDAYLAAFEPNDGAHLLLKLNYASANIPAIKKINKKISGRSDISVMGDVLPEGELQGLIQSIDCYVSPHRSEGLGLTVVEAMFAGKPVIATSFGGVEDFITEETAYVIPHTLVEIGADAAPYPAGYLWAEPDCDTLSSLLKHVFHDREAAAAMGKRGLLRVEELFSAEKTASQIEAETLRIWRSNQPHEAVNDQGSRKEPRASHNDLAQAHAAGSRHEL